MTPTSFQNVWLNPLQAEQAELEWLRNWNRSDSAGRDVFFNAESALQIRIEESEQFIADICAPWFDNSTFKTSLLQDSLSRDYTQRLNEKQRAAGEAA